MLMLFDSLRVVALLLIRSSESVVNHGTERGIQLQHRLVLRQCALIAFQHHEASDQQLREAFPFGAAPRFLIHDRDAKYGTEVPAAVRTLKMSPW
jgi:hypothetical protein